MEVNIEIEFFHVALRIIKKGKSLRFLLKNLKKKCYYMKIDNY